jgi:hypothetical protein
MSNSLGEEQCSNVLIQLKKLNEVSNILESWSKYIENIVDYLVRYILCNMM